MAEKHTIKHCISEANQAIRFRSMVATQEKFSEMLSLEPQVLHISCHGIGKKTQNLINLAEEDEKNYLLFEKHTGEGELVSQKELSRLVTSQMANLDLVFVAACKSEFVGRIFQKCGARHVICV